MSVTPGSDCRGAILSRPHLSTVSLCRYTQIVHHAKAPHVYQTSFLVWESPGYNAISYQADKLCALCHVQFIHASFLPTQVHAKFTSDIVVNVSRLFTSQ